MDFGLVHFHLLKAFLERRMHGLSPSDLSFAQLVGLLLGFCSDDVQQPDPHWQIRFIAESHIERSLFSFCLIPICEGGGDVVGVVTPLVGGVAQVLHGDKVVELSVQLGVQEVEGKEEDREGQVEVEEEKVELKEKRT